MLLVERWILALLRNRQFFSLEERNTAIRELLIDLNNRSFKKLDGCRRSAFETIDRPDMKPLPATRYEFAEWKKAIVNIDYHVERDERYHSVPHNLVKRTVELRVTASITEVEQAFKELKNDLAIRPIYPQKDSRIEAHIFVAFIAYCLQVTLKARLKALAGGLTPRAALEKFAAMQMLDVHLLTSDGRELALTRYTEPDADLRLLLAALSAISHSQPCPCSADLAQSPQRNSVT